jgi:Flp pilus assembly protein TadD
MSQAPPADRDATQWDAVEEATELIHDGRFQEALYVLRDVARADPKNAYAYYFMGSAFYELGQLEPARDAYRAATLLAPSYVGAFGSLAQVLRLLRDHRGAVQAGLSALKIAPKDPDALHAVGLAYAALGERIMARRYLQAFLGTKPEFEAGTDVRQLLEMIELADGGVEADDM